MVVLDQLEFAIACLIYNSRNLMVVLDHYQKWNTMLSTTVEI